jgi:signal recognition particle receptor subunit beta
MPRKLVLRGADAIVFVADSQREMREQNIESLKNMHENLLANNINPNDIPVVLQYNKRDLTNVSSVDDMNKDLNENGTYNYKEAIAIDGNGVEDTFQHITRLVINYIKHNQK